MGLEWIIDRVQCGEEREWPPGSVCYKGTSLFLGEGAGGIHCLMSQGTLGPEHASPASYPQLMRHLLQEAFLGFPAQRAHLIISPKD